MQRTNGAGHVGNKFVNPDPATNRPPTEMTAEWANAVQEELMSVLIAAGMVQDSSNNAQVIAALQKLFIEKSKTNLGRTDAIGLTTIPTAQAWKDLPIGYCGHIKTVDSIGTTGNWGLFTKTAIAADGSRWAGFWIDDGTSELSVVLQINTINSGVPVFTKVASQNWVNGVISGLNLSQYALKTDLTPYAKSLDVSQYFAPLYMPLFQCQDAANEGGEIGLQKAINSTLAGDVAIDTVSTVIRFYEKGGTSRGALLDFSRCANNATSSIALLSDFNNYTTKDRIGCLKDDFIYIGDNTQLTIAAAGVYCQFLSTTKVITAYLPDGTQLQRGQVYRFVNHGTMPAYVSVSNPVGNDFLYCGDAWLKIVLVPPRTNIELCARGGNEVDIIGGTAMLQFSADTTGQIAYFAASTPRAGWLKANGAAVSRTVYATLFAAIGTTHGGGDGSTTFNLPDLRGEFLRGWDDGRGIDAGRVFGSSQGDAIRNITGEIGGISETFAGNGTASGVFSKGDATAGGTPIQSDFGSVGKFSFDASRVVPTASENRPRNIALLACIKY